MGREKSTMVDCEETVSKIASKMIRERSRTVLVTDKDEFIGILSAKNLVKKKIDNPNKTRIKPFVDKIKPVPDDKPVQEMLNSMMINDYKALPVIGPDERIGMITKLDLIRMVKDNPVFKETKARDIMNFPYSISGDDSLTTARSLIRNLNLSRLPVLGKENRVEGVVDTLNLLKGIITKRRASRGELSGEEIKTDDINIKSLMDKNPPKVDPNHDIRRVIGVMLRNKNPTVVVMERDRITGIITPRDILKLTGNKIEGAHVTISGLQEDDNFIKTVVDEEVTNEIRKINKFMPVDSFVLHVDKHHERGKRVKYSVKGRLMTSRGMFFAGDFAWDVTKAVRGVLQKLEREIIKKKERC